MKKFTARNLPTLEPTPKEVFFNRRQFLTTMTAGIAAATQVLGQTTPPPEGLLKPPLERPDVFPTKRNPKYELPSAIDQRLTPRARAALKNNFYEFLPTGAGEVWRYAGAFEVEPWKIEIVGEVEKPMTLDLDALFAFPHEERTYHFRCVERWAMNVPWSGFPLRLLIEKARPKASAKYVRFVSAKIPDQMPGIREASWYPWPYFEGLRLDEAMNELAFVATGIYGEPLLKQHGAPVRIAVPWKYGYKNPKSIVRIEFVKQEPKTFWEMQPHEYGFLSNVNPNIPHPRWAQDRSYWIDNEEWFETPIFNGYGEFVASLYPDEPKTPQKPLSPGDIAR